MNDAIKADALRRVRSVTGHIQGIERMLEADAYCIDVIRQIQAVQGALNRVSAKMLEGHLRSCVITAVRGTNLKERERVLDEISEVFTAATRA
jgi:DNA-binding FrmR family transcriptional regulator